jgi:hypothetical protein
MEDTKLRKLDDLYSQEPETQNAFFNDYMAATEQPVDWAYDVWDELVAALSHKNNRVRAIASQVLCNLSRSDPQARMLKDFDALLAVTKDERFVTARHCLQSIWKVGTAGVPQRQRLMDGLTNRFAECGVEKNGTLIRYDIIQGMRNLYDQVGDASVREKARALIETEADLKYRKKYAGVWKGT